MNSYNCPNVFPADTVMSEDLSGIALQVNEIVNFAIQIVFTGTPTGSFKLQASCDPVPKQTLVVQADGDVTFTPSHWSDVADSSLSVSAAGNVMWNFQNRGFTYIRPVYTDGSSGSSTAIITSAVFNGVGA